MTKTEMISHITDIRLADFLANSLINADRRLVESHIASCDECLGKAVSAYESVKSFRKDSPKNKERKNIMKKINLYLVLAIIAFALSFVTPRYFVQLLVATLILGIKWIVDSKTTKMLVMIYEAWKSGGAKEASRIIEKFDSHPKNRV